MEHNKKRIKAIEEIGKKAKGKNELLRYFRGGQLTIKQAIAAKCYDCLGFYDGLTTNKDCGDWECPIYPFMPYNPNRARRGRQAQNGS